jgi:myo-inositol 2-dehydrogenase/D-chiro-inositol 1-dehydrogenase
MSIKRFAVVGTGRMANIRTQAFLATGKATLVGVTSSKLTNARQFAQSFACQTYFDSYSELRACKPEAVLIEVPHRVQDEIALWAIEAGYHTLIGGCLSASVEGANSISRAAKEKKVIVEAGYEARYKAVWESARRHIKTGGLGKIIAVRSIALWDAAPESWYYSQNESGGMPLTHMTYAFINPIRWLFGEPLYVSAFANQLKQTAEGKVDEETCSVNMLFKNDVLCNMIAGFVKSGESSDWMLTVLGSEGTLEIFPGEMGPGALKLYRRKEVEESFEWAPDAFQVQAQVFLDALDGDNRCRNSPEDTIGDIQVTEAIVASAREKRTIGLGKK